VNDKRHRLSARDYKQPGRNGRGFEAARYRQFGAGLAVGLGVALLVWLQGQRATPVELPAEPEASPAEVVAAEATDPADQLDFYERMADFQVVVPEADLNPRRDQPSVDITRPAPYILQVGSFRNLVDAERHRDRLAKQGIDTVIQHVTIDENEWHRVRWGPSRDLKVVNAVREQLHAAQVNVTVYEVGE
jgi:cell division protein FtsN